MTIPETRPGERVLADRLDEHTLSVDLADPSPVLLTLGLGALCARRFDTPGGVRLGEVDARVCRALAR